jgi:isoquinoline 1-oxidoreductase alpha subunit
MVALNINGKNIEADVPGDMPLLWVVRDVLGLTGTKFGCGAGLCGACTVHLNGAAVRSCQTAVSKAAGKKILTIEGMSGTDVGQRVQQAWLDLDVVQCGYCQPGQIMQAASLLTQKKNPSDAEIDSAMSGNICRCGTYPKIRAAIKQAGKSI